MSTKYPSEDYHGVNTVAKLARVLKRVRACVFVLLAESRPARHTEPTEDKKKWNKQKTWKRINHFCWHCDNCTIETSSNEWWWNFCRALRQKKHEEWVRARMCEIKEKSFALPCISWHESALVLFGEFPKRKKKIPRKYYIETATCSIFLTRGYLQLL